MIILLEVGKEVFANSAKTKTVLSVGGEKGNGVTLTGSNLTTYLSVCKRVI